MANNNPTFESGFLDAFEDLENVSTSATSENNRFANLSE